MKKVLSLLLALTLLLSLTVTAFAVVEPGERFYVADYANVLTESTEDDIVNYNGALEYQCQGAQIVVVTVDYLEGMSSDTYAYQLFNDWGVGSPYYNNGMLLLLGVQENKAWLAYGMGLTSRLSSSKVDELLDTYFWTDFDKGNFDQAVSRLFQALLRWYDSVYGSSVASAGYESVQQAGSYQAPLADRLSGLIRIAVILALLFAFSGSLGGRRVRLGGILPWLFLFSNRANNRRRFGSRGNWDDWPPRGGGGFGGGSGRGGGFGGGFGGGMGRGGGGFSGGGGGRR